MPALGVGAALGRGVAIGAGPLASSFSPSDLPGLVFWHDMQDPAAYTTNAGAVDSITNKVSGVVVTQATSSQRPTYDATGLNGFPCGDYDGAATGDQFVGTEAAVYDVFDDDNPYTLFAVIDKTLADRSEYFFGVGGAGSNGFRAWGTNTTGAGVWIASANNGASLNVESSGACDALPNVFECWSTGTATSISVNGGPADPSAAAQSTGAIALTKFSVGVRSRGGIDDGDFSGQIGEILVWGRELSASERSAVRQYLGAKWGITIQ